MDGGTAVELHKIRADEECVADLTWYFQEREAAFGLASNFGAMVSAIGGLSNSNKTTARDGNGGETVHIRSGRHTFDSSDGFHDLAIGRLASVAKERRIAAGLADLSKHQVSVLQLLYEPRQAPNMVRETFGQAANVAIASSTAKLAYRMGLPRRRAGIREWLDEQCRLAAVKFQDLQKEGKEHDSKQFNSELALVHKIRIEIELAITDAMKAYAQSRRLPPRRGRNNEG